MYSMCAMTLIPVIFYTITSNKWPVCNYSLSDIERPWYSILCVNDTVIYYCDIIINDKYNEQYYYCVAGYVS